MFHLSGYERRHRNGCGLLSAGTTWKKESMRNSALYGLVESFFKNDEGHNVTVNGDRYRAMITNFFIPELNNHDVQELWFRQDGATCHTARATIDLLKDTLGDRLISRFGPSNWPPRSCDLTPLDYFLWGYVKSLVYADKPQTLDHLEDNIRRVIADIRPQMLEKVIENWTSRLDYIRASRGSPMPEIIFKIYKTWKTSEEAQFHLSFTTGKMKIQNNSRKKRCKDASVLQKARWSSGVTVWMGMSLKGLTSQIGHTFMHYSAIADDDRVLLTSLVKMWTPQQKVQCVLWLTEFNSVTRIQRRFRTEWNVVTSLPNRDL
ncbi:DUF4817 domain-containing protein [Trichonephila clavipes]|nr:DUF4817 domain-containing protein [Trichonephila clavipes]